MTNRVIGPLCNTVVESCCLELRNKNIVEEASGSRWPIVLDTKKVYPSENELSLRWRGI